MQTLQDMLKEFEINGYFSLENIYKFVKKCAAEDISFEDYDDIDGNPRPTKQDAIELVNKAIRERSNLSGDPDDYHDCAVAFAYNMKDYDIACEILLRGLERYSANIDLLADYLEYAIKSSSDVHYDKCEEFFTKLQSYRPQRWNWRAYDFSIDYLLDKVDRGIGDYEEIQKLCLELSHEFQRRISDRELGYIAESNIHFAFGDKAKRIAVLKKALKRTNIHVVQSAISLAEIYLRERNPQGALNCLNRVISDLADPYSRTTPAQVFVLSVICKTSKLLNSANFAAEERKNIDKALVQEIIDDWKTARTNSTREDEMFYRTAGSLAKLVETISGIKSDDEEDI